MIKLSEILGQERAVRQLERALAESKVAHAYLFYGPQGVGKETTAWAFIQSLECRQLGARRLPANNLPAHDLTARGMPAHGVPLHDLAAHGSTDACGFCPACRQVEDGNHPDVTVVRPQGASLRLAQVKELQGQIAMKMVQGPYKVALIAQAECLTPEAGNSLLKTLEEPPAGSVFILISSQAHLLLPTIVSRCQPIYFRPLAGEVVEQALTSHGLEPSQAKQLAAIGGGSLGRALALAHDPAAGERARELDAWVRDLEKAAQAGDPKAKRAKAGNRLDASGWAQALRRAEQWSEREDLDELLNLLSNWWYREIVAREKSRQDSGWARQGFKVVGEAIQALNRSANKRLTLEVMFLRLLQLAAQRPFKLHLEGG
ncbi:MAG: DNA polymerase III subunit delta' [Clostridia bacterium]|nr:DNA polymerase III subunit delta' [Clostridia bacterium]